MCNCEETKKRNQRLTDTEKERVEVQRRQRERVLVVKKTREMVFDSFVSPNKYDVAEMVGPGKKRERERELNSTQNKKKIKLVLRFYSFYLQKAACLVRPLHREREKKKKEFSRKIKTRKIKESAF